MAFGVVVDVGTDLAIRDRIAPLDRSGHVTVREILTILLILAPSIWALIDVLRAPTDRWEAAGQSQGVWVMVVLLFSILGPILYLITTRPRLVAVRADRS